MSDTGQSLPYCSQDVISCFSEYCKSRVIHKRFIFAVILEHKYLVNYKSYIDIRTFTDVNMDDSMNSSIIMQMYVKDRPNCEIKTPAIVSYIR